MPKNPRRVFGDDTTRILLTIRSRLKDSGWDYGPMSIWFAGIESGELQPPVPSVSTIARLLRHAGAVESNPRKRPKSSYLRFQRGKAMELWQLDGLKYRLYDQQRTVITIYQLIDDATRKDMGRSSPGKWCISFSNIGLVVGSGVGSVSGSVAGVNHAEISLLVPGCSSMTLASTMALVCAKLVNDM
ncbi:hypothetical protein [Corynebacterium phocae]|uniref:hypothetical protein n=1 Tax=Corynebacterium phocae TaxID=161895 RepID=UPI0012EECD6C|nr:hypothetical protein [Corynebacterium phocae]